MTPSTEPEDVGPVPSTRADPRARGRVSDPKLRAQSETILALPVEERLRQLEAEANFFSTLRQVLNYKGT